MGQSLRYVLRGCTAVMPYPPLVETARKYCTTKLKRAYYVSVQLQFYFTPLLYIQFGWVAHAMRMMTL